VPGDLCQYFRILFLRSLPVRNVTFEVQDWCVKQHRKFDDVVPLFCLVCVHPLWFSWKSRGVRSGDRSGHFCGPPRPIHRSRNCSFMYSVTCRLKYGVPRHAGSTSVIAFCVVQDAWMTLKFYVSFKSSWISNIRSSVTVDNRTYIHMTFLTVNDLRHKILKYWHKATGHFV
jgi:hypothetical protein